MACSSSQTEVKKDGTISNSTESKTKGVSLLCCLEPWCAPISGGVYASGLHATRTRQQKAHSKPNPSDWAAALREDTRKVQASLLKEEQGVMIEVYKP